MSSGSREDITLDLKWPQSTDWCPCKYRDTEKQRKEATWRPSRDGTGAATARNARSHQELQRQRGPLRASGGSLYCWHPDFRLPASITMRQPTSAGLRHLVCSALLQQHQEPPNVFHYLLSMLNQRLLFCSMFLFIYLMLKLSQIWPLALLQLGTCAFDMFPLLLITHFHHNNMLLNHLVFSPVPAP